VHNGDVIPNEECAMAVASSIFNHMEKSANTQNYIPQIVLFDEEDDVWIVSFWEDSTSMMLGGDCSIALQKKDGKVLSIWYRQQQMSTGDERTVPLSQMEVLIMKQRKFPFVIVIMVSVFSFLMAIVRSQMSNTVLFYLVLIASSILLGLFVRITSQSLSQTNKKTEGQGDGSPVFSGESDDSQR